MRLDVRVAVEQIGIDHGPILSAALGMSGAGQHRQLGGAKSPVGHDWHLRPIKIGRFLQPLKG